MDNFDKLIRQKLEQFEAPYNDAHWEEMEAKLNASKSITKNLTRNLLIGAASILTISIASFLYLKNTTENTTENITLTKEFTKDNSSLVIENNSENEDVAIPPTLDENNLVTTDNDIKEINNTTISQENPVNNDPSINNNKEHTNNINSSSTNLKPTTEFVVFNNRICLGEEVSFESFERNDQFSYLWNFGDGSTSNKVTPSHFYQESGTYNVTLTIMNKKTGKSFERTEKNAVVILPQPEANFNWDETSLKHDDNKLMYPYVEFSVDGDNKKDTHSWSFGNGENSTSKAPKIIYNQKGYYPVSLTVKNAYGCTNTVSTNINIKGSLNLYAPNAFTPNNDKNNDVFIPKSLLSWDIQFTMTIKDRLGNVVYQTSDNNQPWNGKANNNGSTLPDGVYFWQLVTYDVEGKPNHHHGKINLLK